ncbi:hypothetical protein ACJX0J_019732 [Zea mays]
MHVFNIWIHLHVFGFAFESVAVVVGRQTIQLVYHFMDLPFCIETAMYLFCFMGPFILCVLLYVMFLTLNIFLMFFFVFFVLLYITMLLTYVHLLIILLYFPYVAVLEHNYILHLYSRLNHYHIFMQSLAHVYCWTLLHFYLYNCEIVLQNFVLAIAYSDLASRRR